MYKLNNVYIELTTSDNGVCAVMVSSSLALFEISTLKGEKKSEINDTKEEDDMMTRSKVKYHSLSCLRVCQMKM
jgi:hypothetical protein